MTPIRAVYENGVFRPLDLVEMADKTEVLVEAVRGRPRSRGAVLALVRGELPRLQSRYGVSRLVLFGSAARDELSAESDVDFAVEFQGTSGLGEMVDLAGELTYLLGRSADVLPMQGLKPAIREAVEREGIVI